LHEAIGQVHSFLHKNQILDKEFIFMSCGDFDGNHLKKEATLKELEVPSYLKRWINIKKAFPMDLFDEKHEKLDTTQVNLMSNRKSAVRGMPDMLKVCDLTLQGKHHSGLDDSKNIAACLLKTLEKDF